jgi:hypothetical protein
MKDQDKQTLGFVIEDEKNDNHEGPMDEGVRNNLKHEMLKRAAKKLKRKLGKSKFLEGLIWQNMKTLLALPLQMSPDGKHFWKQA